MNLTTTRNLVSIGMGRQSISNSPSRHSSRRGSCLNVSRQLRFIIQSLPAAFTGVWMESTGLMHQFVQENVVFPVRIRSHFEVN